MTSELTFANVGAFKRALAEAARTALDDSAALRERYVELRPGMPETVLSRRHHLIIGRRGTGKTSLLEVLRARAAEERTPMAVVDMERYKGRSYPDVLIEIIGVLLAELQPKVRARHLFADLRMRRRFIRLERELASLLIEPQRTFENFRTATSRRRLRRATADVRAQWRGLGGGGSLDASSSTTSERAVSGEREVAKIERLQDAASRVAVLLRDLVAYSGADRAFIFIDDFYFIRLDEQALVLGYLHQVCKGTGVWLKIGGVGTRLRPFRDGDPPVGMQPTQDIDRLPLDVTLEDFGTAKVFLERVMQGVIRPLDLRVTEILTSDARNRLVLGCGGAVARDYITLTDMACDEAIERLSADSGGKPSQPIRIDATDVQKAARRQMTHKEDELTFDADADVSQLRERWRDVCDFARAHENTAFVLVEQENLDEEAWGKEIAQLESLRFLHRIKDTKPNTLNWRGRKCIVFMIDLSERANQRMRAPIIEFWRSQKEFDKLRRAEWVYTPDWRSEPSVAPSASAKGSAASVGPRQEGFDFEGLHDASSEGEGPVHA